MNTTTAQKIYADEKSLYSYREQGFFLAKNLLPRQAVEACLAEIKRIFRQIYAAQNQQKSHGNDHRQIFELMQEVLAKSQTQYMSAARQSANLTSLLKLFLHEKITALLQEFGLEFLSCPTTPVIHIMANELKIPGGYHGVAPHQDWSSIQGSLDSVVVWLPLTPVNSKRFTVDIIPGSHKRGLIQGEITNSAFEIPSHEFNEEDFIPLIAEPGDVVFFNAFVIHRSSKNGSGLRIACSTRFENLAEPTFIERGYPCAYKRSVERQLIKPNFPILADVQKALRF